MDYIAGMMVQEKVFSISESGRASGSGVTVKWLSFISRIDSQCI